MAAKLRNRDNYCLQRSRFSWIRLVRTALSPELLRRMSRRQAAISRVATPSDGGVLAEQPLAALPDEVA